MIWEWFISFYYSIIKFKGLFRRRHAGLLKLITKLLLLELKPQFVKMTQKPQRLVMIRCSTLQAFSVKNKTLENPLEIIIKSCSCSGITTFLRIPFSHKYASHIRICICWILHLYYPSGAGTQERLERVAVSQSHSVPAKTWHILWMSIISLIVFSKLLLHFPQLREFYQLTQQEIQSHLPNFILSYIGVVSMLMRHFLTTV